MAKAKKTTKAKTHPKNKWIMVRHSRVHGYGCFARRFIPKGTRIIEYLGERMSHKEADRRYEGSDVKDNHTFLFIADRKTVIDASNGGNEARFINHSCDGNCESEIEKSRVFIDAIKDIPKGAELGYDYQIGRDRSDPPDVDKIYACRCGSANCRGSMLWPPMKEFRRRQAVRRKAAAARKAGKRAGAKKSAPARKSAVAKRTRRRA